MFEPTSRFWKLFLELFESLPRQGPGNRACAAKALELCTGLSPFPKVVDPWVRGWRTDAPSCRNDRGDHRGGGPL